MPARRKSAKKSVRKAANPAAKKVVKSTVKTNRKTSVGTATAQKSARGAGKKPAASRSAVPRSSLLGKAAPDFTMPTSDGRTVSLREFRGKRVLLYFYPKDDTPGCTVEACAFRDDGTQFAKANTVVIGVSKDSVAAHLRFKTKYNLNFLLASDENTGVAEKYGVWVEKSMYGRHYMGIERSTFLIDEKGIVRGEWRKVSVTGHADAVQDALRTLSL